MYELIIRLSFFFGVFAIMAVWEMHAPCRTLTVNKKLRWVNNLGLVLLNSIILRLMFPAAAVGVAVVAQQQGWGVLNFYQMPWMLAVIIAVIVLDLVIYLQHVLVHIVPMLWRLHQVHHADLDYDVTTGIRFHPLEIILSMLLKLVAIVLLGPPVVAVIIFEVLLNATAMFNHGNVTLPVKLDRFLRWLVVTPDMHRVHHSINSDEANNNFGFNLPWWDRLFGTYRAQPRGGHKGMSLGIHNYRNPQQVERLYGMLLLPFMSEATIKKTDDRQ